MTLPESAPILRVNALRAGYGKIAVLSGIDLSVNEQEMVALVGTNGSGKSTLLRCICGLVPVTGGTIHFQSEDITRYRPEKRVPLGIVLVPESREIFTQQTVLANLKLGAYSRLRRLGKLDYQRDLEFVLSIFPHLGHRLKQQAATLSGGEQQMLAIGRALMSRPRLLILDEPSTGLAPLLVREIFKALQKLNSEANLTIFLVEQNTRQALRIAHRGYVTAKGKIVRSGEALSLLERLDREGLTYGRTSSGERSDRLTCRGDK